MHHQSDQLSFPCSHGAAFHLVTSPRRAVSEVSSAEPAPVREELAVHRVDVGAEIVWSAELPSTFVTDVYL